MADERAGALKTMLAGMAATPWLRQLLIMVAIAASVAVGVAVVLWSQEPEYRSLYASLPPERASAVVDSLNSMGVPYKLQEATGAVMVPAENLHEVRLKLAGTGITHDGAGLEILREEKGFGVSDFMQSKKYQHALETELARSIESMQQVRRARVHLAIPKQTVFVRDRKPPSASIMLDIYPGAVVEKSQVRAIVNLVASSISDMPAEQVTVVDQQGNLLSRMDSDDELALSARQFEYRQRVERAYEDRIAQLLGPITGNGKLRVQVAADFDFTTEEQSRESWNPDRQVVRSEQINTESKTGADAAAGIPGALTNQPPGAAARQEGEEEALNRSQSLTRNYEIERVLNYSTNPGARLRRLSVAVVVDNLRQQTEEGGVQSVPLPQEQIDALTALVRDAVGYDEARGDRITVISADFRADEEPEPAEGPAFWETSWFSTLVKQVLAGIAVLLLVLLVLRPGIRTLTQPALAAARELPPGTGESTAAGAAALAAEAGAAGVAAGGGAATPRAAIGGPTGPQTVEEKMEAMRAAATEDPRRVAQVVKKWVAEDAG